MREGWREGGGEGGGRGRDGRRQEGGRDRRKVGRE